MPNSIVEFVTVTKNNQDYLYPYVIKQSEFNHYVELGLLDITDKHYFKLLNEN